MHTPDKSQAPALDDNGEPLEWVRASRRQYTPEGPIHWTVKRPATADEVIQFAPLRRKSAKSWLRKAWEALWRKKDRDEYPSWQDPTKLRQLHEAEQLEKQFLQAIERFRAGADRRG